ncbi:MAG: hypothetical protein A3C02_01770 [Candidatus Andersenbacteria bacterium RIFCSPHIGHO2_02_FULL_45_11]|uniref:Sec-independent protein translocase protein TatC n=1 Tax=Candidatus Andersenbacteria bacterium RIFCSPHIGHO2_12_FULL_45_11 TaxID=1797281 RepID=A0A1G1X5G6_9BACT|nr:MAG: hypothetical protein A2805_03715 [Candidatus Andersenbacteria bacterium RIFCSPHIGHO2_01_FULL_46_36]OGY32956.1 MAG: hypothetical protein A3C02_01770 [Candidatus Andersenbacteria bacterium RIFCSPHIGHO2_02_FULL_45_11]OGY35021.1 MAG: hypothetical protein A3D99_04465 [Candidatus Andersenbacteria bacterium RIFCSPHIGHO2_12_FULL_45_11]
MTLLQELTIFFKHILHWIYYLVGFSFFFFSFGLQEVVFFRKSYSLPLPSTNSFSVQIFNKIRQDLLPPDVPLIVTNPISAFLAQLMLSVLLAFLLTIPLLLYKIILYLRPALLPHESKAVLWSLLPFTFLFLSGSAFSYFFLTPATFKVLYPYATTIGIVPFFSLNEFIHYVFSLTVSTGLMFLLPLFMIVLTMMGIVKAEFWRDKWRQALLFFLVLSAVVTPDGTGVTMAILFLPLALLYIIGYIFARKVN